MALHVPLCFYVLPPSKRSRLLPSLDAQAPYLMKLIVGKEPGNTSTKSKIEILNFEVLCINLLFLSRGEHAESKDTKSGKVRLQIGKVVWESFMTLLP